jgi:hypothetical protein
MSFMVIPPVLVAEILLIKQQQKMRIQLSSTGNGKEESTVTTFRVTSCQTTL